MPKAGSHTIADMGTDKPELATMGCRVAYAVRRSGLSVEAIADKIKISKQSIYQWIDGQTKNIRNEYLFAFADVTGLNARWIATGEGPETQPRYEDQRIQHALRVMEALPDYAIDSAIRELDTLAELIEHARADQRGKKAG